MKTITIQKSKWACAGNNKGPSRLLNLEGNMCCLGFVCKQLHNISDKYLVEIGTPAVSYEKECGMPSTSLLLDNGGFNNSSFTVGAIVINDDPSLSITQRMINLTKLFADNGLNLVFED